MLPSHEFYLVLDDADQLESLQLLRRLGSSESGCVVATVTPGGRSLRWIAEDLLRAMGKSSHLFGAVRHAAGAWLRAAVWLTANNIRDLIVTRAHLLDPAILSRLAELAAVCQINLWLIMQTAALSRRQEQFAGEWPVRRQAFDDFVARWRDRGEVSCENSDTAEHRPFPKIPLDDFTTFRASCRQLLGAGEFARVDAEFSYGLDRTLAWLEGTAVDQQTVAGFLRELISTTEITGAQVARLRAAQAACLRSGHLLKLDIARFTGSSNVSSLRAAGGHRALAAAYSSPKVAALLALAVVCKIPVSEIAALEIRDVDADAEIVRAAGRDVELLAHARVAVSAQVLSRLMTGARENDPLFVVVHQPDVGAARGWPVKSMMRALRLVGVENGVSLTPNWNDHTGDDIGSWARWHGVNAVAL